jgi:tetratricopeptide (TPR) repeat protein
VQNLGLSFLRIPPQDAPARGTRDAEIVQRAGHAACLAAQKKFEEARQEFSALTFEAPHYKNIHYAFGRFLADMDDVPSAIGEFKRELRNYPDDLSSRLEIAVAEYKFDSAAGVPYAEQAVKLNPRVPSAHYLLGLLYLDTDRYQEAIPELEIAQKALPKDAKICFALGSAYARAGRKQDAARARAAFAELSKDAESRPVGTP